MSEFRPVSYPDVLLREFDESDNDALYRNFVDSRRDLVAAVAGLDEAQQDTFLRIQYQAREDQYRSHYPDARFDVIVTDDEVIGHIYVSSVESELCLVDVSLLPRFQNRGIGRALLQDLLDEAAGLNKCVSLHVIQGNPAVLLYERLGFIDVGEQGIHRRMMWYPPSTKNTAPTTP